jgi:hypothetical protein
MITKNRFWLFASVAVFVTVAAAGCTAQPTAPPSVSANAAPQPTPSATPAPNPALASGTYKLVLSGDVAQCGLYLADGSSVVIAGDSATATTPTTSGGIVLTGPVTTTGSAFTVKTVQGTKMNLALTGTAGADGQLTGTANFGGVNPSGQTGWVCNGPMTLIEVATPASASSSGWHCTTDALQTAVDAGLPNNTGQKVDEAYCDGNWATAGVVLNDSEFTALYQWTDSKWTYTSREAPCDANQVPAGIFRFACQSN